MHRVAGLFLALIITLAPAVSAAEQGPYPKTEEEKKAAFDALQRQGEGAHKLPNSHAVIQLSSSQMVLLGADAQRYSWLISGTEFPATEAVLSYESGDSDVYYEWRDEGYVSDSDGRMWTATSCGSNTAIPPRLRTRSASPTASSRCA